ncbi:hypothetical protein [Bradyrhizobium sp. JR3.5]
MLGPSSIAQPLSAEKQRSSLLGLKKYEVKITCPVASIIPNNVRFGKTGRRLRLYLFAGRFGR